MNTLLNIYLCWLLKALQSGAIFILRVLVFSLGAIMSLKSSTEHELLREALYPETNDFSLPALQLLWSSRGVTHKNCWRKSLIGIKVQGWASQVARMVKKLPAMQETVVRSLGWEDSLEQGIATHSSILAWKIPWTRGAWWARVHGGSQTVRHNWAHTYTHKLEDMIWLLIQKLAIEIFLNLSQNKSNLKIVIN